MSTEIHSDSFILLLNTDLAVVPLSLASSGILTLQNFDGLIDNLLFYVSFYGFENVFLIPFIGGSMSGVPVARFLFSQTFT